MRKNCVHIHAMRKESYALQAKHEKESYALQAKYACSACMHLDTWVFSYKHAVCVCAGAQRRDRKCLIQACSRLHMYVSVRRSVRMYTSARIYEGACVRMHVCICIHSDLFYSYATDVFAIYVYMCIYIYIVYIYVYINTCIIAPSSWYHTSPHSLLPSHRTQHTSEPWWSRRFLKIFFPFFFSQKQMQEHTSFCLPSHRYSYISLLFSSRFIDS